jgi:hypothetical protein
VEAGSTLSKPRRKARPSIPQAPPNTLSAIMGRRRTAALPAEKVGGAVSLDACRSSSRADPAGMDRPRHFPSLGSYVISSSGAAGCDARPANERDWVE